MSTGLVTVTGHALPYNLGMRASLVIPTWNGGPLLAKVLQAVEQQPGAKDLERVAIDSGSSDDTVATLEKHGFRVLHIAQRDFNHGNARDQAIAECSGEIVLLLTQDAVPGENWLSYLLAAYDNPKVAAAYCRQVPRDDCNPLIRQRILDWTAGQDTAEVRQLTDPKDFASMEPMARLQLCAYDNVAGSVRRSFWQAHPFGRRRFGEDVTFGKAMILAGHAIVYEPRATVTHSHNRSPKDEGKRIYCDHANLRQLFNVHVLPSYKHFRAAIASGRQDFAAILAKLDLPPAEEQAMQSWAHKYAFWSALGIYLGGNAERLQKGWLGWIFKLLDRHLRRGI